MQFVWMNVIANEINIQGRARTAKQKQCAPAYQG